MKKLLFAIGATILSFSASFAQTWSLDKAHAKLGFSITHMKISEVDGFFKIFDVKVNATKADFSDAQVELSADAKSINTDNDMRDEHLRGEDYFDVAKHPAITFKSTSVKKVSNNKLIINGILTMHGVSKPVALNATLNGIGENPMSKKTMAGFKISGKIKRSDFKVGAPSSMLGDEVTINSNIELAKG